MAKLKILNMDEIPVTEASGFGIRIFPTER